MTETKSRFVYVTYIRTTLDELWAALTTPEFMEQYWFGYHIDTDWTRGAAWQLRNAEGKVADRGEIVEIDPPHRLVLQWRHELRPEIAAEGDALCTMTLEQHDGAVKLTVTHESAQADSKLIEAVSGGWPRILSNLKTLLETGGQGGARACFEQAAE